MEAVIAASAAQTLALRDSAAKNAAMLAAAEAKLFLCVLVLAVLMMLGAPPSSLLGMIIHTFIK